MHWFWAIVGALLLAAGVVWWVDHDSDQPPQYDARHRVDRDQHAARDDSGPTLYRWVDASGVENITDTPPKGRHYTIVRRDLNRVSLPHFGTSNETTDKAAKPPPH